MIRLSEDFVKVADIKNILPSKRKFKLMVKIFVLLMLRENTMQLEVYAHMKVAL